MIKSLLLVLSFTFSTNATAENIVDLYGAEPDKSEKIIKKYSNKVSEIEDLLQKELKKMNHVIKNDELEKILSKKNLLTEKIKKEGDFLYVDFNTVFYPGDKNKYTTIEVVNKNQLNRLRFISPIINAKNYQSKKDDLINQMIVFINIELQLLINNELNVKNIVCPVYHCISGFKHPRLKPYLKIFNSGAIKEKKLIIDTLNNDPNPERRASAAFLMGHFNDPKEIISLLSPHVNDSNSSVRNNVMRVIAATMSKAKINQIDVTPFLDLLDSPENTDRNKALYVLLIAAESSASKNIIIQKGGDKLLALLQLKQPNNHEIAYKILKKISGKDFNENNLILWKKWLSLVQNKVD